MKYFFKGTLFCALLFAASCSNEFDLTAPWQDTPVIYAILDANATNHYVRVEKGFIDPERSGIEIAQNPDSLYYDDAKIKVYLEKVSDGARIEMSRVDGEAEGFPRKAGIFATQPNYLYKGVGALAKKSDYNVVVERQGNLPKAEATIGTPGTFEVVTPNPFSTKLKFSPDNEYNFTFLTDNTAKYFNISLDIVYLTKNINTGAPERYDTLHWAMVKNARATSSLPNNMFSGKGTVDGDAFFEFLGQNAVRIYDANGIEIEKIRTLREAYVVLEGGGIELEEFYEVLSANSGVSGAESVPIYTNVTNGYGLVTSKATIRNPKEYNFEPSMEEDLKNHPATKPLNFTFF